MTVREARNETVAEGGCALAIIVLCIIVACGFAMSECDATDDSGQHGSIQ